MMASLRKFLRYIWSATEAYGPFGQAFLTVFISGAIIGITNIFIFFNPIALGSNIAIVLTIATVQYFQWKDRRNDSIIVELTVSYVLNERSRLLDKLLGKLISATWKRGETKPGNALFRVLKEEARGGNFWTRRRIAEALPMLGAIDSKRTMELLLILRDDTTNRWGSDIRRRAIEALYNQITLDVDILLSDMRYRDLRKLLALRKGDQIYTAMAVFEAVAAWSKGDVKKKAELIKESMAYATSAFTGDEIASLQWIRDFLIDSAADRSEDETLSALNSAVNSTNTFIRIAAARNILHVAERMPAETLSLILALVTRKQNDQRYIRRPLSKEKVVRFVIDRAIDGRGNEMARAILNSLIIDDPDDIIRITAFDEIDYLAEKSKEYALEICSLILRTESNDELKARAAYVLADIRKEPYS